MNYNEALKYIDSTQKYGSKLGLKTIGMLLDKMDNPHRNMKYIHVAGTNGKGSTSSYIATILKEAGYKVGLFTSPYLERFNERIQINEVDISNESLARITKIVKDKSDEMVMNGYRHPTTFEIITAIAFQYFKEENVDYVVLEVGLGGRIDSTNIIESSMASVITTIDMDHTHILGNTLTEIAYEKAGIIKENGLVISYPQNNEVLKVLQKEAGKKGSDFVLCNMDNVKVKDYSQYGGVFDFKYKDKVYSDLKINLLGEYQIYNAALALTTILKFREKGLVNVTDEEIRKGLIDTKWKGRLEVIKRDPTFLIDAAHNPQGVKYLSKAINIFDYNRLILGIAILEDKDVDHIIDSIVPLADEIIITEVKTQRKMDCEKLAKKVQKYNKTIIIEKEIEKAVEKSFELANENDLILFAGSIYLIGDVRKIVVK